MVQLNLQNHKGFTLIELLVTILMVGILSSIALPRMLSQTAKGRQAEAKSNLGAINRAQQAYRFEKATFGLLTNLTVNVRGVYYNYNDNGIPDSQGASHIASAKPEYDNDILNYALAVGYTSAQAYNAALCEDDNPTDDDVNTSNAAGVVDCSHGVRIN